MFLAACDVDPKKLQETALFVDVEQVSTVGRKRSAAQTWFGSNYMLGNASIHGGGPHGAASVRVEARNTKLSAIRRPKGYIHAQVGLWKSETFAVASGEVEDPNFLILQAIITEGDATLVRGERRIVIADFPRIQLLFWTCGCAAS